MEMEEYFEQEFEDELEAMRDLETELEEPAEPGGSAKRGLFNSMTPTKAREHVNQLNDSFPTELGGTPDQNSLKRPLELSPLAESQMANLINSTPAGRDIKRAKLNNMTIELDQLDELNEELLSEPECFSTIDIKPRSTVDQVLAVDVSTSSLRDVLTQDQVLRRIPEGDFTPISTHDLSCTGYLKISKSKPGSKLTLESTTGRGLLASSITSLKQKVERMRYDRTLERLHKQPSHHARKENMMNEAKESRLWVEKYMPARYMDLLSDECLNRALLKWLKLWDHLVFDKPRPREKMATQAVPGSQKLGKEGGKKFDKPAPWLGVDQQVIEELDSLKRPSQKVVLICGRPGLGKTTLAHIAARHAGYNAIEINASDERTAVAFNNRITDSLTMKPLLASDPRPNLLILDEIDGAPLPAINALLGKLQEGGGGSDAQETTTKKKKDKSDAILRPIICICNDLYTPSLRQLRNVALVLNMPEQCPSRLASRLQEICDHEGLRTDMGTLMSLSNKTSNDVRSCLNTLQFVQRKQRKFGMSDVENADIGTKDEQRTLQSLWVEVFQTPRQKKMVMPRMDVSGVRALPEKDDSTSNASRARRIYRAAQTTGDFTKICTGLHENYLSMHYKDPRLKLTVQGAEWLCYTDILQSYLITHQAYVLVQYQYFLPVVFHLNFSQLSLPKIAFPRKQFEVQQKINHSEVLVDSMVKNMEPTTYRFISTPTLVVDILNPLIDVIIQPPMRPVSIQLYSQAEKNQVAKLVGIMIAYNLKYIQLRSAQTGQYQYLLEPAINELCSYPGSEPKCKPLSYAARQQVNNEITNEFHRRRERKVVPAAQMEFSSPSSSTPKTPSASKNKPSSEAQTPTFRTPQQSKLTEEFTPNHKRKLTPKNLTPSARTPLDFFGRKIHKKKELSPLEAEAEAKNTKLFKTEVYYQFKEGYSNAVRKRVKLSQLL